MPAKPLLVVAKAAVKRVAVAVDSKVATSAIYRRKCKSAFVSVRLSLADKVLAPVDNKVLAVAELLPLGTMEPNRSSN